MAPSLLHPRMFFTLPKSPTTHYLFSIASRKTYTTTAPRSARNRIYSAAVRTEEEFENLNLLSASSRVPLITLWTASWCPSCKVVSPLVQQLIRDGVGEDVGNGVSFVEVELDSPTIGGLMMRYGVSSRSTWFPSRVFCKLRVGMEVGERQV